MNEDWIVVFFVAFWIVSTPLVFGIGSLFWWKDFNNVVELVGHNTSMTYVEIDTDLVKTMGSALFGTLFVSWMMIGFFLLLILFYICGNVGEFYLQWRDFDSRLRKAQWELARAQKELKETQTKTTLV